MPFGHSDVKESFAFKFIQSILQITLSFTRKGSFCMFTSNILKEKTEYFSIKN